MRLLGVAVTRTPDKAMPDTSTTVPLMVPSSCAATGAAASSNSNAARPQKATSEFTFLRNGIVATLPSAVGSPSWSITVRLQPMMKH